MIRHIVYQKRKHFFCISLNGANEVIASPTISVGVINKAQVHPREVFVDPITDRASANIIAHNHPTGNVTPGKNEIKIIQELKVSGETPGIKVLDDIIFSHKIYYSFTENRREKRYQANNTALHFSAHFFFILQGGFYNNGDRSIFSRNI